MIRFLLGLAVGVIIVVIILLLWARSKRATRQYLTESMDLISSGRYDVRMYPYRSGRIGGSIYRSFNRMAEHIQREFQDMSQERDVLRHILQNMTTGVVYLRSDGQVQMVNQAAERLFRRPSEQWQERDHWTVFRNYNLGAAIDHALLFGNNWTDELTIREGLTVQVRLVPISSGARVNSRGESSHDVLMLVNDVSEWRRLERMRSEFVANVSHELKTPIAAIRGFSETLLDGDVDDAAQTKFLRTIYDESMRMGNLVSDLLELSKLEATDSRVDPITVDLLKVVERAFDRLRTVAAKRSIHLELKNAPRVNVWADPDMLLQVFLNLLSNAIHYSSDGSQVTVTWDVLIDRVKVHVRDNGVGIPAESLNRVFERFYRVHKDRSRASGGTGLGLAIVKHIITALGGEVGVDSVEGEGSDFWFTLSRLNANMPRVL
ncbi:two-component system histidine kinase PnpS [Alicyclobacillus dauci]|uniref:histidine kinase n=1 Tax=Alicyclobacillus dauci TaxID=1475485 RepID=A0ABY6Z484_9BACL|nr:HAMP domain-containing sensor histidine kinase [Alicyclobacillus dauci]WAH37680.1 ATP-binding protein [Alicyclobacillus dauci]